MLEKAELKEKTITSIHPATPDDIPGILSIQKENLLKDQEQSADVAKEGFLIYPFTAEDLEEIISDNTKYKVNVAIENNEPIGYIAGYDLAQWQELKPDWKNSLQIDSEYKELLATSKVMYGRHIAVLKNHRGKGPELMEQTLNEAAATGYEYFLVEVLKEPIANKRSAAFVIKNGFNKIGQATDHQGFVWDIFLKKLID